MSVVDIAFHRSTAVTVGVVWAGFVSRFWWPSEARRELSKQLGEYDRRIFRSLLWASIEADLMRP
jgi:hypothetical protein